MRREVGSGEVGKGDTEEMRIVLKAKSSGSEPYDVEFLFDDGDLQAHCTCKAGIMHVVCRHRLALLRGDESMLADPSQAGLLCTVVEWSKVAGFWTALEELDVAEAMADRAREEVKRIKKRIAYGMIHGLRRAAS